MGKISLVDKPRERLARFGASRLSDGDLLCLLISSGNRMQTVSRIASSLLKSFGLDGLSRLTNLELCAMPGIGQAKAGLLQAAFELGRRVRPIEAEPCQAISGAADIAKLSDDLVSRKKEHFLAYYLDSRNRLLGSECVSVGTINASLVHPREVFEPALKLLAAGVILVHNHPSGSCQPSQADINVTGRIGQAADILGLNLLDHVIVGKEGYYSFANEGKLPHSPPQYIDSTL